MTRRQWKLTSVVAGGDGGRQRLTAVMDEGGRWRLTVAMDGQQWMIDRDGVQWRRWVVVFDGGSSI